MLLSFSWAEEVKNNVTETGIIIGNISVQLTFSPPEIAKLVMGNTMFLWIPTCITLAKWVQVVHQRILIRTISSH